MIGACRVDSRDVDFFLVIIASNTRGRGGAAQPAPASPRV
jgi:hypothetical protein